MTRGTRHGRAAAAAMLPMLLLWMLPVLGGCDTTQRAADAVAAGDIQAQEQFAAAQRPPGGEQVGPRRVTVRDGVYVGGSVLRLEHGRPLPPELERDGAVVLTPAEPLGLQAFAAELAKVTGIPVRVVPDPTGSSVPVVPAGGGAPPQLAVLLSAANGGAGATPLGGATAGGGPGLGGPDRPIMGRLSDILALAAATWDVEWEYLGPAEGIVLARWRTEVLPLDALAVDSQMTARVGGTTSSDMGVSQAANGGSTASSMPNTSQANEARAQARVWDEVRDQLHALLPSGSTVAPSPVAGTVTVTSTPAGLRAAREFVSANNRRVLRQIHVEVAVLTVRLHGQDQYALDLSPVYNMAGGVALTAAGPQAAAALVPGVGSFGVRILDPPAGGRQDWGGAALIRALSSQGDTRIAYEAPVTTTSGVPVSVQDVVETGYLRSVSRNTAAGTGTGILTLSSSDSVALEPGTVIAGFQLMLLPRVLGDGRIGLQFALQLSDLRDLKTVSSGGLAIQTPERTISAIQQQAVVADASTLVLAGYQRRADTVERSGVGRPAWWLAGGGVNAAEDRTVVVVAVTPHIVGGGR